MEHEIKRKKKIVETAICTNTDLYIFDVVQEIIEGSTRPRDSGSRKASELIIRICEREKSRLIKKHDLALTKLGVPYGTGI